MFVMMKPKHDTPHLTSSIINTHSQRSVGVNLEIRFDKVHQHSTHRDLGVSVELGEDVSDEETLVMFELMIRCSHGSECVRAD